jgi:hypothetical protein
MERPTTIEMYLRTLSDELGKRILDSFLPLHGTQEPPSPLLAKLLRKPYPAQAIAVGGIVKRLAVARSAAVVAECGTGKTLISLASAYVAADGKPFTGLVLAPPHLVLKWARESLQTVPHARVFLIDGLRDSVCKSRNGIQEVRLRGGQVVREGLKTTLTDLRLRKNYPTARARWNALCPNTAIFVTSKETAKLSNFWRHAYNIARSGRFRGSVVNPDTGRPICAGEDDERLLTSDFKKVRLSEWIGPEVEGEEANNHARRKLFSPLWQADRSKVRRYAVIEFVGRYVSDFFDFGIADEVHELKGGDTAQGNALGTLASCVKKLIVLTGTLLGGYADDVYNILFRADAAKMIEYGFDHDEGVRPFMETYGLLETITTIEPAENACSEAKVTRRVRRRPGASPQLFG